MFNIRKTKQKRILVALGISTSSVQIAILKAVSETEAAGASLQYQGKTWQLVVNDEERVDDHDPLAAIEILLERYKRFDLNGQPVQVVLSSGMVEQVSVDKPQAKAEDIVPTLQWTLKDLVSIPPADLILDYYDIPVQVAGAKKINVVAISRAKLEPWVRALNAAGLQIMGIVNLDLAFIKWVDEDLRTMIVSQVSGERPHLQIIAKQKLIVSRRLPQAFDLNTIDPHDSERMEALAIELQRSQDFYSGQLRQAPLADIELAIHHQHADVVAEVVAAQLGMQVSALKYPTWSKELAAGDYTDVLAISGLLWLIDEQPSVTEKGGAS